MAVLVLFATILIIWALVTGLKSERARRLAYALLTTITLGAGDVWLHILYLRRRNCGSSYDLDVGCVKVLPGWLFLLGFVLLLVAIILSVTILVLREGDARKHSS